MIRPYLPKDKVAILELIQLNTPTYFAPEETEDLSDYLDHEVEDYFVFELDNKVVGCGGINYFPEKHIARISWDLVHPDYQGQAIGSRLTKHRIAHIKQQANYQLIIVRTSQLVFPYYEKMGFSLEKVEKDFWAKGLDLYQMRMDIK